MLKRAFKFRLYPSKCQSRLLEQTLETCRRWYNGCLGERTDTYEDSGESVTCFDQIKQIKDYKDYSEYAAALHTHNLMVACRDLEKAMQAFFRRVALGEKPGYPRFKGRNRFDSFGYAEYGNGFKLDGRRLKLYGIGRVAVRWHREFDRSTIKTLRVSRKAGKWYACFSCEIEQPEPLPATGCDVGIDLGISSLLTTTDGEHIENPRWYKDEEDKLGAVQQEVARRKKRGKNRGKSVRRLQRQHERIANRRKDYIRKLVCDIINRYDRIAIEDLSIDQMTEHSTYAKGILDSGWGYFKQQLLAKAECAGRVVVKVDPAYTSKTCSHCGFVKYDLKITDRTYKCPDCGLVMDRDENAAFNILALGRRAWDEFISVGDNSCQESACVTIVAENSNTVDPLGIDCAEEAARF